MRSWREKQVGREDIKKSVLNLLSSRCPLYMQIENSRRKWISKFGVKGDVRAGDLNEILVDVLSAQRSHSKPWCKIRLPSRT